MTDTGKPSRSGSSEQRFEPAAAEHLIRVRASIAQITARLGTPTAGASELSRTIGVDKKLAWQISNLLSERDPLRSARYLPGPQPLSRFWKAAEARGVTADLIDRARNEILAFQSFVSRHAGDEAGFENMVASHHGAGDDPSSIRVRRQLFEGNSALLRGRAHGQVRSAVVHLDDAGQRVCFAIVRSLVGLVRYNEGAPWLMGSSRATPTTDSKTGLGLTPLVKDGATRTGVPIWPEFTRGVGAEAYRTTTPDGFAQDWIPGSAAGLTGAVDCTMAEYGRFPNGRFRSPGEQHHSLTNPVRTPCEWIVVDQFIDEAIWGRVEPRGFILSDVNGRERMWDARPEDRLDITPVVDDRGMGLDGAHSPAVPLAGEIARSLFARLSLDPARFMHFRMQMQYPPVPSTLGMFHPLPVGGDSGDLGGSN
jgi:hypothetical protein